MPEIKNQFTGGKMNKDLDERLVPKGEYRDAMNIQVTSSEGSEVGTIQNILGNQSVSMVDIHLDSICVGSISDEKNDAFYWFVREPEIDHGPTRGLHLDWFVDDVYARREIIFEHKNNSAKPIFVDTSYFSILAPGNGDPATGDIQVGTTQAFNAINVGDTISGFISVGTGSVIINQSFIVQSKDNSDPSNLLINIGDYTAYAVTWSQLTGKVVFNVNKNFGVLNFPENRTITGINIVDDMLFWTDGITEPKRINITRSAQGTDLSGLVHTMLINEAQGITIADVIKVKEEHITVVRKAPLIAPRVVVEQSLRTGTVDGSDVVAAANFAAVNIGQNLTINIPSFGPNLDERPGFLVGDVLLLAETITNLPEVYDIRVEIIQIINNASDTDYIVRAISISTDANANTNTSWFAELETDGLLLFERKFPRFAYRYKYTDNEYSTFSPFTNVAFFPDDFNYEPIKAYNKGMTNTIKSLKVTDFIGPNTPKDVKSIDILYKNETSPIIYLLDTISNDDAVQTGVNSWNSVSNAVYSSFPNAPRGSYSVDTENIARALPENQSLRSWDNVPKKALAQEVSGNRIIYGNYTQGYDLLRSDILSDISTTIKSTPISTGENIGLPSIKSLRNYEVGVVWGDKYGRETPVITSKSGAVVVPKSKSKDLNSLAVTLNSSPEWSDYYRFYVKETSNEYYNLALDRTYDADDGNIWLSFPSVDRNKIDEDTYIILKKGIDSEELIIEEARYKVVAIENEAPDYIKTTYDIVTRTNQDESRPIDSCNLWAGANNGSAPPPGCTVLNSSGYLNAPRVGRKSFSISQSRWAGAYSISNESMGLPNLIDTFKEVTENATGDQLYVSFTKEVTDSSGTTTTTGNRYRVVDIVLDPSISASDADATTPFIIYLKSPILSDDEFVVQPDGNGDLASDNIHVIFWKKTVTNKPEFDGRFFVKILNDSIAKRYLSRPTPSLNQWVIQASTDVYRINDTTLTNIHHPHNWSSSYNYSDPVGTTWDPDNPTPSAALNTESEWKNALKFGGSTVTRAWFIDNAPFASTWESGTGITSSFVAPDGSTYSSCDKTSKQDFTYSAPSIFGAVSYDASTVASVLNISINENVGTGYSFGRLGMKGIHTNAGEKYIDLSYSQIPPDKLPSANGAFIVGNDDNQTNTSTDDQGPVMNRLIIGSRFRLRNSSTIYKIKGINKYRLLNWMGDTTIANAGTNLSHTFYSLDFDLENHEDQIAHLEKSHNRRATYRINYEIDFDASPVAVPTTQTLDLDQDDNGDVIYSTISNSTPAAIEFLTEFQYEGENKISSNPAIFETEPKEDVDLDLYYEASSSLPVAPFSERSKFLFLPVGTTITPPVGSLLPEGIFIVDWDYIPPGSTQTEYTVKLSNTINQIEYSSMYTPQNGDIEFLRDDGTYVTATIKAPVPGMFFGNFPGTTDELTITPKSNFRLNWHNCWSFNNGVESNRIGDTYNKPYLTNGATLSTVSEEDVKEENRTYGLIYSGIYNSNSGTNNLNQFIQAEKITKDINPTYGSIQKLHAGWGQSGDLLALCEDRVLKILANKDALFNADGNTNITSTNNVLGTATPYNGEFGISKNPESFAQESYRIYFTDKVRGAVMRLSTDGLTPISNHGMKDWFKDNLKDNDSIIGSYDDKKDEYNVTLPTTGTTVSFTEASRGWVSFKSFVPENAISCANDYYTFKGGKLWKHHVEQFDAFTNKEINRNTFYGAFNNSHWSTFTAILNDSPEIVKSFKTINYEGTQSRVDQFTSKSLDDYGNPIPTTVDGQYYNLQPKDGWYVDSIFTNKEKGSIHEFIEKEGKWFNYIKGNEISLIGDLVQGSSFDQASAAIQGLGVLKAGFVPTPVAINGCTDSIADNYNPNATVDDGSCTYGNIILQGCMDPLASNYNVLANLDDGNCVWIGCTDTTAINYDATVFNGASTYLDLNGNTVYPGNVINDPSLCLYAVLGCTDPLATNYNPLATTDDGSCIAVVNGCSVVGAFNYDASVNVDDGSCTWYGCTNTVATNFVSFGINANNYVANAGAGIIDDGSCLGSGCMDSTATNYDPSATYDDLNPNAPDYSSTDGSCVFCDWSIGTGAYAGVPVTTLVMDDDPNNTIGDGQIAVLTDLTAPYQPFTFTLTNSSGSTIWTQTANQNLGGVVTANSTLFSGLPADDYTVTVYGNGMASSCSYTTSIVTVGSGVLLTPGCTDATACNYDASATADDGSCEWNTCSGCMDTTATNYNLQNNSNTNDPCTVNGTGFVGNCTIPCGDGNNNNGFGTACCQYPPVLGCTDPAAFNYNPSATQDDGTCVPIVLGCLWPAATNYDCATGNTPPCNDNVNTQDPGSCIFPPAPIKGCMDPTACNYNPLATQWGYHDNGETCFYPLQSMSVGNTDSTYGPVGPAYFEDWQNPSTFDTDKKVKHYILGPTWPLTSAAQTDIGLTMNGGSTSDPNFTGSSSNIGKNHSFTTAKARLYKLDDPTSQTPNWVQVGTDLTTGPWSTYQTGQWHNNNWGTRYYTGQPFVYQSGVNNPAPWSFGPTQSSNQNYEFDVYFDNNGNKNRYKIESWFQHPSNAHNANNGNVGRAGGALNGDGTTCGSSYEFEFYEPPCLDNPFSALGCTDTSACNYDMYATCDDGSCYHLTQNNYASFDPGNLPCVQCLNSTDAPNCTSAIPECGSYDNNGNWMVIYTNLTVCNDNSGVQGQPNPTPPDPTGQ